MSFERKKYKLALMPPTYLKSQWWIGHIPFAFELIGRLRPQTIVELGTYSGSSFVAFCQAVKAAKLQSRCYGIDLWEGDIHMGQFDESIYEEISSYLKENYPHISHLIRASFNDAARQFEEGSIDLLHIDGTHTFEAVSNDFFTWLPKMSPQGVILFHDTNVTYENVGPAYEEFGVKSFVDSIKKDYNYYFEFKHCYGLGVLFVGHELPGPVLELIADSKDPAFYRFFEELGNKISEQFQQIADKKTKEDQNNIFAKLKKIIQKIRSK